MRAELFDRFCAQNHVDDIADFRRYVRRFEPFAGRPVDWGTLEYLLNCWLADSAFRDERETRRKALA